MNSTHQVLTQRPAWKALAAHHQAIAKLHLRDLFAADAKRGERLTAEAGGLFLDYSKNRVTDETLKLLVELAADCGLRARIDAMFARQEDQRHGEPGRAARRPARAARASFEVDGENVVPEVHAVLDKMAGFANRVRSGEWKGHTGKRIRNVDQHRHRRFGPGAGDGVRGAEALQRPLD